MTRKIIFIIPLFLIIYMVSYASTPEAWKEFEQNVRRACEENVKNRLVNPDIVVDPYPPSVGVAIAEGKAVHSKDDLMIICIYDKRTKKAEIGSELRMVDFPWYKKLLEENENLRKEVEELRFKTFSQNYLLLMNENLRKEIEELRGNSVKPKGE